MCLDDVAQLVAARMLQHADRNDLVVDLVDVAEVGLAHLQLSAQAPALDFVTQPAHLLGGGVQSGADRTDRFQRTEHEAAEAAADVDVALATR